MKIPPAPRAAPFTRAAARIGLARLCNAVCNGIPRRVQTHALANAAEESAVSALTNAGEIGGDGWIVIPFGDSLHSGKEGRHANLADRTPAQIEAERTGVIQRFTREDALALVNDYKSGWLGRIKRAFVGLPVFKGHPDAARFAKVFPDKTPRGTIADMEVRDTGLALKPVLTEQGAEDVEGGWNQPSPYWLLRQTGEEAGRKVLAPFKLLSLGLVPRGNIAGLSLVNSAEPPATPSPIMNEKLKKFLASIGLSGVTAPAETADDTALANGLDSAATAIATLKADKAKADDQIATLTAQVTALTGEKTALANAHETALAGVNSQLSTLNSQLAATRTAAAKRLVAAAVKAGKLSAALAPAQETALANAAEFEAEAAKLDALKPALRTASQLGDLGATGKEQLGRTRQVHALVNAHMEAAGCDYDAAFTAIRSDPKHAPLFAAMKRATAPAK